MRRAATGIVIKQADAGARFACSAEEKAPANVAEAKEEET